MMTRVTLALAAALFAVVVAAGGCPKDAAPVATPPANADADGATQHADDVKPVYDEKTPPDPRATALCNAVRALPAQKKAACCQEPPGTPALLSTCTGSLSAALLGGAVKLDDAKAKACADARAQALDGCAWVGPLAPALPAACTGIFSGSLDEGARCRSSLECKSGLRCHGASPLDAGRCGKPGGLGARCGGVDALSVVLGETAIDADHPECAGVCVLGRCQPLRKTGDACPADLECGPKNRCDAGKCVPGRVAAGGACDRSGCVDGTRCVAGTCTPLRKDGETCKDAFDCARGGCVKGVCGMYCMTWQDLTPPKGAAP